MSKESFVSMVSSLHGFMFSGNAHYIMHGNLILCFPL